MFGLKARAGRDVFYVQSVTVSQQKEVEITAHGSHNNVTAHKRQDGQIERIGDALKSRRVRSLRDGWPNGRMI